MATKLHEILAVETALEKTARKLCDESIKTFGKDNLFKGATKALKMFDEADDNLETTEVLKLTTTVDENLDYLIKPVAKYWDTVLAKELANSEAKADVVLEDGTVLAKDMPATFLLGMEAKLSKLRAVYEAIPTLEPGIKWIPDANEKEGVFMNARDIETFKTKKSMEFLVAYEATKEHPAQIRELENTTSIGKYLTTTQSGKLPPVVKAHRIARVDEALLAFKKARMRANQQNVNLTVNVGVDILNFINDGKV